MEIGSEFWVAGNGKCEELNKIPEWLNNIGEVLLTSSGRGALTGILNTINPKFKKVLLPCFICESVIAPFVDAGYELSFYNINIDLTPHSIEKNNDKIGVFLHMGYFGMSTNVILKNQIKVMRRNSVIIIEDVTHTLFSGKLCVNDNDFVFGSLRKWLGIPSGGFIASKSILIHEPKIGSNNFVKKRKSALEKKCIYIETNNIKLKKEYMKEFSEAEKILNNDREFYSIDKCSQGILNKFNHIDMINKRVSNYKFLLMNLEHLDEIDIIFSKLLNDVCPLFFPIYVKKDRNVLRKKLINEEIYCPIHWPLSSYLNGKVNLKSKYIYDSILSIPCDQRYSLKDMSRIILSIKNHYNR